MRTWKSTYHNPVNGKERKTKTKNWNKFSCFLFWFVFCFVFRLLCVAFVLQLKVNWATFCGQCAGWGVAAFNCLLPLSGFGFRFGFGLGSSHVNANSRSAGGQNAFWTVWHSIRTERKVQEVGHAGVARRGGEQQKNQAAAFVLRLSCVLAICKFTSSTYGAHV